MKADALKWVTCPVPCVKETFQGEAAHEACGANGQDRALML